MTDLDAEPARALSAHERAILERLFEPRFPGREELRAQLDGLVVRPLDDEGCLKFEVRAGAPRARVRHPIPTEGEGRDDQGGVTHVELHVVDGLLRALTLWSEASPVARGLPAVEGMKVFAAYSEDAGVWNSDERFL
ncbi:MAG TPA: hypothetical protein VHJ20_11755 [Polyangia bacterium]|nr:hypothetical protein [Polyangia bacterium]